jgi:hypothetical protein
VTDDAKQEGPVDPFDPAALRVNADDVAVSAVRLTVPVRRPGRQEFFRVNPADEYTLDSLIYVREVDGLDRDTYLVVPALYGELADVCRHVRLFTCISRRDVLFLWPVRLPDADGAGRLWHTSALEIADLAKKSWLRMRGDRDLGAYVPFLAKGDLGEPTWPDEPLRELLKIASKERFIDSLHHDALRELRGER